MILIYPLEFNESYLLYCLIEEHFQLKRYKKLDEKLLQI